MTLFGLVLAIGIVVDDAIVVVEAVEHHIEHGLAPRDATIKAMQQVSGPVIAVGLVLSAVFVPCAFISGITGQFFRQFALTISVSTIISAFNSLTLSPALTALLLKPISKEHKHSSSVLPWPVYGLVGGWMGWEWLAPRLAGAAAEHGGQAGHADLGSSGFWMALAAGAIGGVLLAWPINWLLGHAFRLFNLAFDYTGIGYTWLVGKMLRISVVMLVVYGGLLYLTYREFETTPKGFIPSQDMGYLFVSVQLPDAASMERTERVLDRLGEIAAVTPGVLHVTQVSGQSFALNAIGSNFGTMFINLEPYSKRRTPELASTAILGKLYGQFSQISDAIVQVFPPPPIRGVGRAGGFAMVLEDRGDAGLETLQAQTDNLIGVARENPKLSPQIFQRFRPRCRC